MADEGKRTFNRVMIFLRESFDKYAAIDGREGTMTKREFAELLRTQEGITEKYQMEHFFYSMDQNGDDNLTFKEFMTYLADLYVGFKEQS